MAQMFDWNDLRAFLAVAREGSTLGAARVMGVNQTTVARRIEALEQALELKLFERGQTGSRLTAAAQALFAHAEQVEAAAGGFETQVQSLRRGVTGVIRVTANESLANLAMVQAIADFRRVYPNCTVELIVADSFLDLASGEADVAVRGTAGGLPDSNLIARKLVDIEWGIYAGREYAQRHGVPRKPSDLANHILVGGEGLVEHMPPMRWMVSHAPNAEVHCRSSSLTNLAYAIRSGLGVAPLPCLVADHDPELVRCLGPVPDLPSSCWVVTRPDVKDTPRIRAFIDFLTPHFQTTCRQLTERGRAVQAEAAQFIASLAKTSLAGEAQA